MKKVIITLIILNVYIWGFMGILLLQKIVSPLKDLGYSSEEKANIETTIKQQLDKYYNRTENLSDTEWKVLIYKAFGNPLIFEIRIQTGNKSMAKPELFFIVVNKNITGLEYAEALAHELMHVITWIGDERKTQFETFKKMYESEDDFLRFVAWKIAQRSFQINDNYTCTGLIIDYLKRKENLWI